MSLLGEPMTCSRHIVGVMAKPSAVNTLDVSGRCQYNCPKTAWPKSTVPTANMGWGVYGRTFQEALGEVVQDGSVFHVVQPQYMPMVFLWSKADTGSPADTPRSYYLA